MALGGGSLRLFTLLTPHCPCYLSGIWCLQECTKWTVASLASTTAFQPKVSFGCRKKVRWSLRLLPLLHTPPYLALLSLTVPWAPQPFSSLLLQQPQEVSCSVLFTKSLPQPLSFTHGPVFSELFSQSFLICPEYSSLYSS